MRTLVLDKQYQSINFIYYKRLAKHLIKEKVEVLSYWENVYFHKDQKYPAIVRLKDYVRKKPRVPLFNKKNLFKRDNFFCQYTGEKLPSSRLTVDHIIPVSKGGKSTWENCVTASIEINGYKGDRSLAESGLTLLSQPMPPAQPLTLEYRALTEKHPDWAIYFVT